MPGATGGAGMPRPASAGVGQEPAADGVADEVGLGLEAELAQQVGAVGFGGAGADGSPWL